MTFYLAAPIYVTAISALFLKEPVGWRRWSAVVVGFVGVIIALRPSSATLTWPALIAIVGSLGFAVFLIITRMLRGTSDVVMVSGQFGAMLLVSGAVAPIGWIAPSALDFGLMLVLGVVAMSAFACMNRSLKLAPASVVVPYQYTMIVWAVVLGWLVFGDVPDAFTLTGAAIIIGAGLYILWREQIVARREPVLAAPPELIANTRWPIARQAEAVPGHPRLSRCGTDVDARQAGMTEHVSSRAGTALVPPNRASSRAT